MWNAACTVDGTTIDGFATEGDASRAPCTASSTDSVPPDVTDPTGNALGADLALEFTFLRGDVNGDGRVNLQDFNVLAANFGKRERLFTQGDLNYDGVVNLTDFNLLAGAFGATAGQAPSASHSSAADEDESRNKLLT